VRSLSLALALALAALALAGWGLPPVLDEESYLDIARQITDHPSRPYDWWRRWQPWGADHPPDAFLFAHPPLHLLWVSAWQALLGDVPALRLSGLPWAALYGAAAGWLLARERIRPALGAALLLCPALIVALQATLMIDLGVLALSAAAVAAWRMDRGAKTDLAAGLLLGLACAWKYPALILVPALLFDDRSARRWPAWVAFAALWGGVQLWLFAAYGRLHLLHVLATAPEIGRGPLPGRALGVLVRLGLIFGPLAALALPWRWPGAPQLWALAGGAAAGAATWGLGLYEGAGDVLLMAALGAGGGGALALAVGALRGRSAGGRDRLYGAWALLAILAVVVGHNYAGARYLLPAALPLAVLAGRALHRRGRWGLAAAGAWCLLGVALARAERAQAQAADALAMEAAARWPEGRFTGEWTLRWRLAREGWTAWAPGEALPPGAIFAAPVHHSPAPLPEGLTPVDTLEAPAHSGLRLTDLERGIGYHAETLGPLPFGWADGPLERLRVYKAAP